MGISSGVNLLVEGEEESSLLLCSWQEVVELHEQQREWAEGEEISKVLSMNEVLSTIVGVLGHHAGGQLVHAVWVVAWVSSQELS